MRLSNLEINNFRSIKHIELDTTTQCKILVGINESGKSNILKAISLLGDNTNFSLSDIREPKPDEEDIDSSYVDFVFELSKDECDTVNDRIKSKFLFLNFNEKIITLDNENLTLKEFCYKRNLAVYHVNIKDNKRIFQYYICEDDFKVIDSIKKISENCPSDFSVKVNGNTSALLTDFEIINIKDYPNIPLEYYEDATIEDINELIGDETTEMLKHHKPEAIFWTYNEKNLLPSSINIDSFIQDPNICTPLKSMFELAELNDISTSINNARNKNKFALRNLLNKIADMTTKHFRKVWSEYDTVEFSLLQNGSEIEISIKDKFNHYELSQRSDGFKRFVTFLLLISAKVASNTINNSIIIIDEPDITLHPSGVRSLRDELIKISKNNHVFISTHSIFMIDKEHIERHIIVKKDDEITSIEGVTHSNIYDEEVLYNALGYSIFDSLKLDNIIFEGWTDKVLLQTALKRIPSTYSNIKKPLSSIGLCHSQGVKSIKNVASLLELANRNYIIISDCDKPAIEKQKEYNELMYHGQWKKYDDFGIDIDIITCEDFLKVDAFKSPCKFIKNKYNFQYDLDFEKLNISKSKISVVEKWITENCSNNKGEILREFKLTLFDDLKPSYINENYYLFLKKMLEFYDSQIDSSNFAS